MHQRMNELISFNICKKNDSFEPKKIKFDHSFGLTSCFFCLTLNFSKHGCNGGEKDDIIVVIYYIQIFV